MTGVWLVIDDDCVDNTEVFAREEDAERWAADVCSPGSSASYQKIIGAVEEVVVGAEPPDCLHCGYPVVHGSGAAVTCDMCGAFCCEEHHRRHPSYAHHDIAPDAVLTGQWCAACAHPESLHVARSGDGVAPCPTCAVCIAVHTGHPDDDEPGIDDELDIEEYDHSRAKEDSRNARYRR